MPADTGASSGFADFTDYQHHGTGLLRATAELLDVPRWPEPGNTQDCRCWLADAWRLPGIAPAIRHASPVLAARVATILDDPHAPARDVQRATLAGVRYVLRAQGRPTPFGTFAGVGPVTVRTGARVRWDGAHRPVARVETRWLHRIVQQLEADQG